jgi:hypothetical protein
MRFDLLIDRMTASVADERLLLRRVARYVLPLLLLPAGPVVAQVPNGWLGLLTGGLIGAMMLGQAELFIRPTFERARLIDRDLNTYLGIARPSDLPSLAPAIALLVPSALALLISLLLFLPTMLAAAVAWQRLLALALAAGALLAIWQRLAQTVALIEGVEHMLADARRAFSSAPPLAAPTRRDDPPAAQPPATEAPAPRPTRMVRRVPEDGLLDPALARRVAGLPLPALRFSPAAIALLRVEAYVTLRDFPATSDRDLIAALADLGQQCYAAEQRHFLLPPVGGKIYLPVAANGTVAAMLGATARRLAMDGAYSATLGTWLVRLPPAHSYVVAGRLIDAVVALHILPPGTIAPHHLTVQGDLGREARLLSVLHLAATPLLFEERPGGGRDERPFIMRGGGVLDDMGGRGRSSGARTDFIDGFLFVQVAGMDEPEHLAGHTLNLRLKQTLAYGLLAEARPSYSRSPFEQRAAQATSHLRDELRALLTRYELADALDTDWLDGEWSQIWPIIRRMSTVKQRSIAFLDAAQDLRDAAMDELEGIAEAALRATR